MVDISSATLYIERRAVNVTERPSPLARGCGLALRSPRITRPRIGIALADRAVLAVDDVLDTALGGHLAALGLGLGLGRRGVGHALVALGLCGCRPCSWELSDLRLDAQTT